MVDIGLRMLSPRELARAQGFPADYVLNGTKSSQVARIGNSVVPTIAEALVKANCSDMARARKSSTSRKVKA
jgi:DNA (cytosine-5)-methyltransferase 1